jgi:beta-phosphoglucomutase-like phosphatase (HAD superfamily)
MLRAIVFDFDGVIANTEPLHFRAYREVLAAEGIDLQEADYYARYLGYDDAGAFRAVGAELGGGFSDERIAALIAQKAERLEALERHVSVLFPGAGSAIRRAAAFVPIGIASGALGLEVRRVLDLEGLTSCFTTIVAAEDTLLSKPAPDPYLRVVALLEMGTGGLIAPSECVAVEDSHWGLESARAAGLRTVGVAQSYPASALSVADLIIDSIDQLDLPALSRLCSSETIRI